MAATTSTLHQTDSSFPIAQQTADYDFSSHSGSTLQESSNPVAEDAPGNTGKNKSGYNESDWASPASGVRPAENPLEAIDELEDAIEEVGQSLTTVVEDDTSTVASSVGHEAEAVNSEMRGKAVGGETPKQTQKLSSVRRSPGTGSRKPSTPSNNTRNARNAERPMAGATPRTTSSHESRPHATGSRKNSHSSTSSTKTPNRRGSEGSQQSENSTKLSVHKPAFVPTKSTKAPTIPTFELPGEAISRRKREKLEEKRRKEEEEQQKRREFKARDVKYDRPAEVRETATSRARANRMSQIYDQKATTPRRDAGTPTLTTGKSSRCSVSIEGDEAQITSTSPLKGKTSLARTADANNSNQSRHAAAGPSPSIITKKETGPQMTRGRELFLRERAQVEERKKKEEAAKRAKAEAAERSRQLGRAFAERQRQKAGSK